MATSDLKSFNYLENGDVVFSMMDTIKSTKMLDSGVYKISYLDYPASKVQLVVDLDSESIKIHHFPDKDKIDKLFSVFFDESILNRIVNLGFYHKVGLLLHGKEGTGKSTIIKYYYNKAIVDNKAIVFHINCASPKVKECWDFISGIRRIQDNPIIIVFEEFDEQMTCNEAFLKTVLDGNSSINNCIFFAATNYIEKIPAAMKDRPSRFKYVFNIESIQLKVDAYELINKILIGLVEEKEMQVYAQELTGQTLDYIKQFCLDKIMDLKTYSNKKATIGFSK